MQLYVLPRAHRTAFRYKSKLAMIHCTYCSVIIVTMIVLLVYSNNLVFRVVPL